jgi:ABC-type multidrug transport system fused ATPase/permease subunit
MLLKKILTLLTPKERRRGFLLMVMVLIMALMNTIGVASIIPFMSVLGQPDIVYTNKWLNRPYTAFGFSDPQDFLFFLGILVFAALVSSIMFKALTQYALQRFTQMRNCSLSCKLFKGYLNRPYIWFLNRHSSDLILNMLSEVNQVINGVLIPILQLFAHGMVVLFLIILLMLVDPILVMMVALVLGGTYTVIYLVIRKYLSRIGKDRVLANRQRFRVVQEALGGIKEIKIFHREQSFFNRFTGPAARFSRHQASNNIASIMPRFLLEIVAFGGILLIALYLLKTNGSFNQALPILSIYALAGYRLLPALQQIFAQVTSLRFGLPALESVYKDIIELSESIQSIKKDQYKLFIPKQNIQLKNISFTYPGAQTAALKNLDLTIPARATIGLVGSTGSGKTSAADVILGLLYPQEGQLLVDGKPITPANILAWQRTLGYVPQQIYLSDDTVAANIAFGISEDQVDMNAVIRAAKITYLHDFVSSDLEKGYETLVGERGIRLSGGQIQRIGIARALYYDPAVLIFDEATSALDNKTEQLVMEAIGRMDKRKTIILIAHRLNTVKHCDCIFIIENGKLVGQGTYNELLESNRFFQTLTK